MKRKRILNDSDIRSRYRRYLHRFFLIKDGIVKTLKIPSTLDNPAKAVLEGVKRLGNIGYLHMEQHMQQRS